MNETALAKIEKLLAGFTDWLQRYGETSWDHQSYFGGPVGRRAKALYYRSSKVGMLAVAPMIFSEAFIPSARRLFAKPLRFPIADPITQWGSHICRRRTAKRSIMRERFTFWKNWKKADARGTSTDAGVIHSIGKPVRERFTRGPR